MLKEFVKHLNLEPNEILVFTSNLTRLLSHLHKERANLKASLNTLLDYIIGGGVRTLILQSFNWDFCYAKDYDILKSKSYTGSLSNIALKRADFKRTKHPIYSFAVKGKDTNLLCALDNKGAFSEDSAFSFMYENDAFMIVIDLALQDSFTFVHFVEQKFKVSYRYHKNFSANYTDENNRTQKRTYSMFVRKPEVLTDINALEEIFVSNQAMTVNFYKDICIKKISLRKAYDLIALDITQNNAFNLHKVLKA